MQLSQEQLNIMLEAISDAIQYTMDNEYELEEESEQKKNEYIMLYRQIASLIDVKVEH